MCKNDSKNYRLITGDCQFCSIIMCNNLMLLTYIFFEKLFVKRPRGKHKSKDHKTQTFSTLSSNIAHRRALHVNLRREIATINHDRNKAATMESRFSANFLVSQRFYCRKSNKIIIFVMIYRIITISPNFTNSYITKIQLLYPY